MEKQAFKHENKIILRGPIVRKFVNDVACNFTIKTPRLNLPNVIQKDEVAYNYPEVSFYGDKKDEYAEKYKEGDVIEIEGMIQTHPKLSKESGRNYFDQKLIGLSVKEAERILMREFGYDVGAFVEAKSEVLLGGVISKISTPSKGVLTINIRTFINGRVNNIQTFLYERNVGKYMEEYRVGDQVFAVGTIQTPKKTVEDGQTKFYKNIVLTALCKAE